MYVHVHEIEISILTNFYFICNFLGTSTQPSADEILPVEINNSANKGNSEIKHIFPSRLSQSAQVVLGSIPEVVQFDKARQKHKQFPQDKRHYDVYMDKVARIHCMISAADGKLRTEIKDWEMKFYAEHEELPNSDNMATDQTISAKLNKLRHAKSLLKKFRS